MRQLSGSLLVVLSVLLSSHAWAAGDDDAVSAADRACARRLVEALQTGDNATVAELIEYPHPRPPPLGPITTAEGFVEHFDEFFDADTIDEILSDPEPATIGWRGAQLARGRIWFNGEGLVAVVNSVTPAGEAALDAAKKADSATLHPSAQNYDSLELEVDCPKLRLHLRVEEFGNSYSYFAWKIDQPLSDAPRVVIRKGTLDVQGTIRSRVFTFRNAGYLFELDDGVLLVTRRGVEIASDDCH